MVFIDFQKNFDNVHRDYIWEALCSRSITDKIIAIIKATNNGAKFFKANHNQDACFLQPLIHEAWDNESFPSEWTDGIIIKLSNFLKNLREWENWRDICVLPPVSKIIAKVILERIKDPLISTITASKLQRIPVRSAYGFHRFSKEFW